MSVPFVSLFSVAVRCVVLKDAQFFEPNIDTVVEPLAAALRLTEAAGSAERKQGVAYSDFLEGKVGRLFYRPCRS